MGLSTLINISRKLKEKNSEMVVVCNTIKILQLFNIAQIDTFFKIFSTIEAADKYFLSKGMA
jgi:anti-anti-sigma regulatory factor